jgi:hypothetical protein
MPNERGPRIAILMTALLGAACGRGTVDAPPPIVVADVAPEPIVSLPPSFLEAPISYDLSPALSALEHAVPRTFGNINERRELATNKRVHTAFAADREPFSVSFDKQTVLVDGIITYQGRGWYKPPLAPEVSGSCGVGTDRPRARVRIASTLRITSAWKLRASSKILRLEPFSIERRDQCRVTMFAIDVTDRVMNAARSAIEEKLATLDQRIAALDVRGPLDRWWRLLQRPIQLSDSVWLQINPNAVQVGTVAGSESILEAQVGLRGLPRIVSGPRPKDGTAPLPPLETNARVGNGLFVLLEGSLDYDVANSILQKQLVGKTVRSGVRRITIREARLSGIGARRVALAMRFDGSASGQVYFVGTPRYDSTADRISVPDLDYDVGTADLLVHGLNWLKRDDVLKFLRTRAQWPVTDLVETARVRLERGMNRDLGQSAHFSTTITAGRALDVRATRRAILVWARAQGQARLSVWKAPKIAPAGSK